MFLELCEHLLSHLLLNKKIGLAIEQLRSKRKYEVYLLPNAGIEGHYDLVHETDIEFSGEIE